MNPDFCFKLGMLLGTLDDFLIRAANQELVQGDIDRVKALVKDVKKKFYLAEAESWAEVADGQ